MMGEGAQLPHLEAIQRSFGQHNIRNVKAHTSGAAQQAAGELGAEAYAMGEQWRLEELPACTLRPRGSLWFSKERVSLFQTG